MSPYHGWRLHCLVRGLSISLSWTGLLTYISDYLLIHIWIDSILKSEWFTISLNIHLEFFYSCGDKNSMLYIFFFQVAKLVILDECVIINVVFQIMVCDVSWNVTALKRTATILMDVKTFHQVHIFDNSKWDLFTFVFWIEFLYRPGSSK